MNHQATSPAPQRGFSDDEFEQRLERAQALMAVLQLDALLLTTEPEFRYFSGFLTQFWQSPTRPWFLVVPKAGKPIAIVPSIGGEGLGRSWLDDIRTWPSPRPEDEGISLLAACLAEVAGRAGRVGLPMGPETHLRMPMQDFDRLLEVADGIEFTDDGGILRRLRMVKSESEIEKIAYICDRVSGVFESASQLFARGQSEIEAFRAFKQACLGAGADDVCYLVGATGQGGYADIISPASDKAIEAGDVLILDTGSVFDGYYCDFDRNYAFGHADDAVRRAYETAYKATEAGLAAARPGVTCAKLFEAMQAVLDAGGALGNDVGRLGHGLGMQLTEWPSNAAFDETPLEVGMVITLEPGLTFAPGKVMVHEENLVIREDGPQLLTRRAPPELPII